MPAAQPAHQGLSKKTSPAMLWGNLEVTQKHRGRLEHVALLEGLVLGPSAFLSERVQQHHDHTHTVTDPKTAPVKRAPWSTLG